MEMKMKMKKEILGWIKAITVVVEQRQWLLPPNTIQYNITPRQITPVSLHGPTGVPDQNQDPAAEVR